MIKTHWTAADNRLLSTQMLILQIEVGTQKVLLSIHTALYLKNNTHGLLPTGQA